MGDFGAGMFGAVLLIGTLAIGAGLGVVMTNDVWVSECSKMGQTVTRGIVYQCSPKEKK